MAQFNSDMQEWAAIRGIVSDLDGVAYRGERPLLDLLGFDYDLTCDKPRMAVRAALSGASVVVTNPDVLTPTEDGFDPCVGALAAAVTAAVPAVKLIIIGKPHSVLVEQALSDMETERSETIMIGDQVAADIVAGQKAGLRSILVTTGLSYMEQSDVTPDRIISSLLELTDSEISPEPAA